MKWISFFDIKLIGEDKAKLESADQKVSRLVSGKGKSLWQPRVSFIEIPKPIA
jgi:hypothetical protein